MLREELLRLQKREVELVRVKTKIKDLEREKSEIAVRLESLVKKIESARAKLKEKENSITDIKNFIKHKEAVVEELKKKKEEATTREEFKRILRAIAKEEDEVIKARQRLTKLEIEAEALADAHAKVLNQFQPEVELLKEKLLEVEGEIKLVEKKSCRLKEEIDRIKSLVPEEELKRFEQLKDRFSGLVFADITSGSCEGCGMTYSSAEFKEILRKLQPGRTKCPYCGRFIYIKVRESAVTGEG